jgi:Do/DeqQ family serine protease
MITNRIKSFGFITLLFTLIQCQAKPKEISNLENGNFQELTELLKNANKSSNGISFVAAAAVSTPCVVHIKTKIQVTVNYQDPFHSFFGFDFYQPRTHKQESSGSGVIIAKDGYIVTNYHVIQNATEIEVTLRNKNTYSAKVIGTDKDTDLALLKIEENNLPAIELANSDEVMVGEWVLAVGNPFNLESTVTQGIVSAKGRSLTLGEPNQQGNPIESFIQTDAAVNPGNSGGALVNLNGQLIGINTAIASPTGAYAGYAFAVPSNIVGKVMKDLKQFGTVQRAYLGIKPAILTSDVAKKLSLSSPNGVLVDNVFEGSAAKDAGLKSNDVIVKINTNNISSFPELKEHLATHSPGDKVNITYIRNGSNMETFAVLKNMKNTTEILKNETTSTQQLGLKVQALSAQELNQYRVPGGVKILKIEDGIIARNTKIRPGFVITSINDLPIKSENELTRILTSKKGSKIVMDGFYPDAPYIVRYEFMY